MPSSRAKSVMKIMNPDEQLIHNIKTEVFMKTTSNPIMSKSTRRFRAGNMSIA